MYLIYLYGQFDIPKAIESATFEHNTIVLVRRLEDIPPEVRRWRVATGRMLNADGSGGIRIGYEGSDKDIVRNSDGTFTVTKFVAGSGQLSHTGSLQECATWLSVLPFTQ